MKKLLTLSLALVLALSLILCADAEEQWADYTCAEQQFSTKIPVSGTAGYNDQQKGLVIYTDVPGYIPYVTISRRPMDKKFSNPVNYLNNVYREYMENTYGDRYLGMYGTAKKRDIGGKQLISAEYRFKVGDYTVVHLQLIEVRDAGDVEYTVKYIDGKGDVTLAVLDETVRNYRETDAAPQAAQKEEKAVLRPADVSGMEPDTENGIYYARITDTDRIEDGGFFTAELYVLDTYPLEQVNALQEGDKVEVNGTVWTVASLQPEQDGACELRVREELDGYIAFTKDSETTYTVRMNDWAPSTMISSVKIMLPLCNDFSFFWMGADDDAQVYDADAFIKLLRDGSTAQLLTQYNTMIRFSNGLMDQIGHMDYPTGPEEEPIEPDDAEEPLPDDSGIVSDVPVFLTPSVFAEYFNAMMTALADKYAEALGEEGVRIVKEDYTITQQDPQGVFVYLGNNDWTVEAGFLFENEADYLVNAPALTLNFNIRNTVPDGAVFLTKSVLTSLIAYHFQGAVTYNDLADWFDNVNDPSDTFTLPGYTLSFLQSQDYTQYAMTLPAEKNPYLNGTIPVAAE